MDSRGKVVNGQKRVGTSGTGTIFKGWDAAYVYDDIGNRTESRFGGLGGSSDPVGSGIITYTANALNQYEEIANPRAAYVMGTAAYATSNPALHTEVVINSQTADRSGVNFVEKVVPSGTGPKWEPLNLELVRDSVTQSFQLSAIRQARMALTLGWFGTSLRDALVYFQRVRCITLNASVHPFLPRRPPHPLWPRPLPSQFRAQPVQVQG